MSSLNKRLIAPLLSALLLQGCLSVGPNYERPDLRPPAAYLSPAEAMPAEARYAAGLPSGAWWSAFQSSKLDAAIGKALANNPTIEEADATLASAAASLRAAQGRDWPQIDGNAGRARERINPAALGFPGFPAVTLPRYSVGAEVSYDLDLFGGNRRSKEYAQATLDSEAGRAAAARLTLAGNVVLQAMEIASLQSQIRAAQEVIEGDKETLALSDRAVELGSQPKAASLAPAAQLAQDEAELPPLQSRLAIARNALSLLLGEAPGASTAPDFTLADFSAPNGAPIVLPSELVRRRPDILAAESSFHAAVARIGVKTADLYPHLSLTASISQMAESFSSAFDYGASSWRVGGDVTAPLFHGGELRAQVSAAKADAQAAAARYRGTVLRAFVEVANALSGLTYDTDALLAQRKALEAAEANMAARRKLYELGRGDLLDALDAQRQANVVRRDTAAAEGARLKSLAALYAATAAVDPSNRPDKT